MRIAIVTDAWTPQVNGVVRTLRATRAQLESMGHQVMVVSPDRFLSLPCPGYAEIRLALTGSRRVGRMIADFAPEAVHIATEGPLGWAARAWCLRQGLPFTTAYHTRFPNMSPRARRSGPSGCGRSSGASMPPPMRSWPRPPVSRRCWRTMA